VKILLATRNAKKLAELRRILPVEVLSLDDVPRYDEVPETGLTFAENALLKAREGVRNTGLPTIADDSGLAVDALGGMPGVFSARWAGGHGDDLANLELLLAQIADVPDEHRGGAFVCAAALVLPDGAEHVTEGEMRGRITRAPRGTGGFGYDPLFEVREYHQTFGELSLRVKQALSHRARAVVQLRPAIRAIR